MNKGYYLVMLYKRAIIFTYKKNNVTFKFPRIITENINLIIIRKCRGNYWIYLIELRFILISTINFGTNSAIISLDDHAVKGTEAWVLYLFEFIIMSNIIITSTSYLRCHLINSKINVHTKYEFVITNRKLL